MRPGWGRRHPDLVRLLESSVPAATQEGAWAGGRVRLRTAAHTTVCPLPDELILSVRCIVRVGDRVVVCTNRDGIAHPWPGGRREPGETLEETARREVHEETGWLIDPSSIRWLGWLHLEHLDPQPDDTPHPHPDFLQVVCAASANDRDGGGDRPWSDTEGYELSSRLATVEEAADLVGGDPLSRVFLAQMPPASG